MPTRVGRFKPRRGRTERQSSGIPTMDADNIGDEQIEERHFAPGALTAAKADASLHTQPEADVHAGLSWADAHPVPEGPVSMNGQELQDLGAPQASGSALRKAELGQPSGIATLDAGGKVPVGQIPAVAITSISVVADIAARDALNPEEGDVARVLDKGDGEPATYMWDGADWKDISVPSEVLSVAGKSGDVSLVAGDIGGLGSMAEQDQGTGASQHRTNSQMDGRYPLFEVGSYTGDGTINRQISVGFRPRVVFYQRTDDPNGAYSGYFSDPGGAGGNFAATMAGELRTDLGGINASGFIVTGNTNLDTVAYRWVAYR